MEALIVAALLVACGPQQAPVSSSPGTAPAEVTQMVEVTRLVEVTRAVLVVVTATPVPLPTITAREVEPLSQVEPAVTAPSLAFPSTTLPPTFTPVPLGPTANTNANLRSGPGTQYDLAGTVAPGQALEIVARTADAGWYQLAGSTWIAAFLVDHAPSELPVAEVTPAPTPTPSPSPMAAPDEPKSEPATPLPAPLTVDFINPHYECELQELMHEAGPDTRIPLWGYRSFQIDLFMTNHSAEPVVLPWKPKRWIITDGVNEMVNDMMWQWYNVRTGKYEQPTIYPGATAGWTFVAFPIGQYQWLKTVEFEWQGNLYRQEFDLGPYGNAYNYVADCGFVPPHTENPTPTPRP